MSGKPTDETPASWRRQLLAVPRRNEAAHVDEADPLRVVIRVRTRKPWYLNVPPLRWMVPVRPERQTVLDKLGSEIWRLCDGRRTVEAIVDAFAAAHRLTFHESRTAVSAYLASLVQRGALAMELPPETH